MKRFARVIAGAALLFVGCAPCAFASPPNILVIMADDMGYGDLGCTGSRSIATPNLDQLAADGMLCTQAYVASSVCSPSRAGFMTGRDPRRFGYEGNLNASADRYATRPELLGLPVTEHTLADHLGAAGYRTAVIGKWHLGSLDIFHPNRRGFDFFCGMLGGSHQYFPQPGKSKIERNGVPVAEFRSPYLTDFFSDEAIRWIRSESEERPWFLFLSYNAPHTPMQSREVDLQAFRHIQDKKRRTYAGMVRALDRGVGQVVSELKRSDQWANTLIVFLSDNGGATSNASWNGPLSGTKGTLREGGIRVPMIWQWPHKIAAGKSTSAVISSLDFLPTFLAAASEPPLPIQSGPAYEDRKNRKRGIERYGEYDGLNLLPMLCGDSPTEGRRLFWRLQGQAAVLSGGTKLIRLGHRPAQMFDVSNDVSEQQDLASNQGQALSELFRELGEWEASLPTVPLWDSSPYWWGASSRNYDNGAPRPEPR